MRRREFIALGWWGGCVAARGCDAQQAGRVRRIGMLLAAYAETDSEGSPRIGAFRARAPSQLGWIDGPQCSASKLSLRAMERSRPRTALAAEAGAARGRMSIVVIRDDPAVGRLQPAHQDDPHRVRSVSDPVGSRLRRRALRVRAATLPGFNNFEPEIGGKWLELLREIAPELRRVARALELRRQRPHAVFVRSAEAARAVTWRGLDVDERARNADEIRARHRNDLPESRTLG